jgi:hypothetical protein
MLVEALATTSKLVNVKRGKGRVVCTCCVVAAMVYVAWLFLRL